MKALKVIAVILAVILLLLLLTVVFLETRKNEPEQTEAPSTETQDTSGTLSWEAYLALTLEEQDAYFQQFESAEAFEKWLESVRPTESTEQISAPDWSDKKPDQYTWEEYLALSREEQDAFFLWFASEDAFEAWMEKAKPTETEPTEGENPGQTNKPGQTDKPGQTNKPEYTGKKPSEYTWEEYQKLSQKEQDDFYQWFGSQEAFEQWMEKVKPAETEPTVPAWDKTKKPSEYTWEEYETLTNEEKDAFFLWFGSESAFEAWMEQAKPAETEPTDPVWDKPGKKPNEYTWDEYQALSQKEQDAFYLWFESQYAFEQWMESVKPAETEPTIPAWDKAKKPSEYTWEEFEALTDIEKESFYQWFESNDAFEEWMDSVQ